MADDLSQAEKDLRRRRVELNKRQHTALRKKLKKAVKNWPGLANILGVDKNKYLKRNDGGIAKKTRTF